MEVLDVEIIDEDVRGNGIAKVDGVVIFVKGALLGEKLKIQIESKHKRFWEASILEVIEASNLRIEAFCPYYHQCGGCQLQHVRMDDELRIKQNYLEGMFPSFRVQPIISINEYHYRNKVTLHVENGVIGYYQNSTNSLVEIGNCPLLDNDINEVIGLLRKLSLDSISLIMIRKALYTNEIMVQLQGDISKEELLSLSFVTSLYLNDTLIFGTPYITEVIGGVKYTIFPEAFFQVNTASMVALYDVVKKYAGHGKRLLDLYCGTGTIGIYLHDAFDSVVGVEINPYSIKNANLNKELNSISNVSFVLGDASCLEDDFDVVVVDPPRSGLSKKVIDTIFSINSERIIYVSCNPDTLKRDLGLLEEKYRVLEITPVNMFPRTKHVECVCVLNKR